MAFVGLTQRYEKGGERCAVVFATRALSAFDSAAASSKPFNASHMPKTLLASAGIAGIRTSMPAFSS